MKKHYVSVTNTNKSRAVDGVTSLTQFPTSRRLYFAAFLIDAGR